MNSHGIVSKWHEEQNLKKNKYLNLESKWDVIKISGAGHCNLSLVILLSIQVHHKAAAWLICFERMSFL